MTTTVPLISVCIPAYNRAGVLPELLDSIVTQDFDEYEIVICEDSSPERSAIRAVAQRYAGAHVGRIRYFENTKNLGYDGNLRHLVEAARGTYCLFMGNDDLLAPGALKAVAGAVKRYPNVGVVLRTYAAFEGRPENVVQEHRYFPEERYFPPGAETIATVFRRSVVISGMVIHRGAAQRCATGRFDGGLLYQLWLVANTLVEMGAVYLPQVLALYRTGGVPDFGNSVAERARFVPRAQTPESSLHFMRGMLMIADTLERERGLSVYKRIMSDIGNYSYPVLAIQANKPVPVFVRYGWWLARMGFWRYPLFHVYFIALLVFGNRRIDRLIAFIKRRLGHTPTFGRVYKGKTR